MKSATQLLTERIASLGIVASDDRAVDHAEEPCSICGGSSSRGVPIEEFISDSLTDQNTFRCQASAHVCVSCAFVRARLSPVPGRLPKPCDRCDGTGIEPEPSTSVKVAKRPKRKPGKACEKCDGSKVKESGGRYGNFSHFLDEQRIENASKGEKPKVLSWLRGPKFGWWFCVVADSGQKHLLPYAPLNPPGSAGRIRFEEQELALPRDPAAWSIVDDTCALLTAGATKEEIATGIYSARAHELCGVEALRLFETRHAGQRGGAWFSLALWLSQRDEEAVQRRLAAEVETKQAAKAAKGAKRGKAERHGQGTAADVAGRDAARSAVGLLKHDRVQQARAVDDPAQPNGERGEVERERRRVGDAGRKVAADRSAWQLSLFDAARALELRQGAERVARHAPPDHPRAGAARGAGAKAPRRT